MNQKDSSAHAALLARLPASVRELLREEHESASQKPVKSESNVSISSDAAVRVAREQEKVRSSVVDIDDKIGRLMDLGFDARCRAVETDEAFHHPVAVGRLLLAASAQWGNDAQEAEDLSRLALAAADRLAEADWPQELVADLRGRAHAQIGNAQRIGSRFQAAASAMEQARRCLAEGSGDPLARAALDWWEGCLLRELRRFPEAIALQQRACAGYRKIGDNDGRAHAMISLANTYREAGDPIKGLELLQRTEGLLDEAHQLWPYIRHNQVYYLIDLGRTAQAQELLEASRHLYARAPGHLHSLRLRWVEGRLALAQGDLGKAEALLTAVRDEFIRLEITNDAAVVSLEIAEVYAREARHGELKELAADMVSVFGSQDIERETLAALIYFQRAAEGERATQEFLRGLHAQLSRRGPVHSDPGYQLY